MDWEAIATIAEVVGAVGVIASLVYVGVQVRQSADSTRAATTAQTIDQSANSSQFLAQDKDSAALYFRGLDNPDTLDKDEKSQFFFILLNLFRRYENSEYQYRQGLLAEGSWVGLSGNIKLIIETPGFRWWWPRAEVGFSPDFRKLISEMLSD